jgi:hypothetical protein
MGVESVDVRFVDNCIPFGFSRGLDALWEKSRDELVACILKKDGTVDPSLCWSIRA